jgi:hypothetical protein
MIPLIVSAIQEAYVNLKKAGSSLIGEHPFINLNDYLTAGKKSRMPVSGLDLIHSAAKPRSAWQSHNQV